MFEETNPSDFKDEEIEAIISPLFPESNLTIKFLYHGTYNVYMVNDEFIFRFPSRFLPTSQKIALVQQELKTLRELKDSISWVIPNPIFSEISPETQFIGYRKIPGESLTFHFDNTSTQQKTILAEKIASFLSELHPLRISSLDWKEPSELRSNYQQEWTHFHKRIKSFCYKLMTNSQAAWVDKLFNNFLTDDGNFEFKPVLIHGDFDTSNILTDPQTMQITGIIDFEETRYYDPAYDLIFVSEGREFLLSLLKNYKGTIDSKICDRILFLFGRQPLHYIHSGLEHDLESMVHYGLDALDGIIRNWNHYSGIILDVKKELEK